jgi:ATP-grasp domain
MAERALVLQTGKALLAGALAPFAGEVELLDLRRGDGPGEVPDFAPGAAAVAAADAVMAATPFAHVVASSESNLAFAGFLRSRYGLAGMGYDEALLATNKWRMRGRLRDVLPSPRCWLSGDFAARAAAGEALPAQVVVKPLSGSSTKGVRRVDRAAALRLLAATRELLVVEEAIDVVGELHVDGLVRDGALVAALPSAYDRPVLTAAGTTRASTHLPAGDARAPQAVDAARRMAGGLGIADHVFHLELLEAADGALIFGEVGLRPAGGGVAESLQRFHGLDLWAEHVRVALGRPPLVQHPPSPPATGLTGVIGVAADPGQERGAVGAERILSAPWIVGASPGGDHASAEARDGSSCAFSDLAFFACPGDRELREALAALTDLATAGAPAGARGA